MYKVIVKESELKALMSVNKLHFRALYSRAVYSRLLEDIECLNRSYGADRHLENDLGGYVIIVYGNKKEVDSTYKKILSYHKLDSSEYEYQDKIVKSECEAEVTFWLYLCSSDYSVEIVTIIDQSKEEE